MTKTTAPTSPPVSAPFGSWESSISADMVAGKSIKIAEPQLNQERLFWLQSVAEEKGRNAIMMEHEGEIRCILPQPLSAKSKVHEYGGGSYLVEGDWLYFVLADDQQIYKAHLGKASFEPIPLTQTPDLRFADLCLDSVHQRLIAVCEDHSLPNTEPANYLVSVSTETLLPLSIVHRGADFYAYPRLSPDASKLCWISWNHPDMPWDNSELWLASLTPQHQIIDSKKILGNGDESVFQPQWSPDGTLFAVSDRNNWWNIYRFDEQDWHPITQINGEFATPLWTFNMSTYCFTDAHTLIGTYTQHGFWYLIKINTLTGDCETYDTPLTEFYGLTGAKGQAAYIAASASLQPDVFRHTPSQAQAQAVLNTPPMVNPDELSQPQPISFPSSHQGEAHGFFYPPKNTRYRCDKKPPLIVICHGGPTGATSSALNFKVQYWTNRGFAVLDVNYRGSTGFGRQYRHLLKGQWGIYDVDDVCAAADYAVEQGLAAKGQTIIKGSSAGGYTVLAALAFRDTFDCGVSLYGIGDLETLAQDTHKFEARYLDTLVGPYPEQKAVYHARSPIHFVNQMSCPILVFQGLEDRVVPPNQAQSMVDATENKGLPVAYVTFEHEGHGFRQAESIKHMLDCELEFYQRIFRFNAEPFDSPKLLIKNEKNL